MGYLESLNCIKVPHKLHITILFFCVIFCGTFHVTRLAHGTGPYLSYNLKLMQGKLQRIFSFNDIHHQFVCNTSYEFRKR